MKKYLLFLGLLAATVTDLFAQRVLLEQDVAGDTIKENYGPNRKHFGHFYLGFGFIAGPAEASSSDIKYLNSHEFALGYRYKYRVGNFYALGFEMALGTQTFAIKQHAGKAFPTPFVNNDEEKLKFTNLGLGLYNRFNFGKRGNYIGNFLDLGVYGNWLPFRTHVYENDFGQPNPTGAKAIKVRETGLKYVAETQYGVTGRIGFNRLVFYGTYRLSDLFSTGYQFTDENGVNVFNFAELPRLTVGLQIGMHK